MRPAMVLGAALLSLGVPRAARAWDPLKSAGHSLGAGAIEAIKPGLASTIDDTFTAAHGLVADVDQRLGVRVGDVDQRLGARVTQLGGVATQVIARADDGLANRISQLDNALDKRITQLASAEHGVVKDIDTRLKEDLDKADTILRDRTRDIGQTLQGALSRADEILSQRIEQLDEAVERRLGNVDVIATKQRLAIEQTLIRVAVLVGLIVFLVFVLVRLWQRWSALERAADESDADYRWRVARALGGGVALQLGGAAVAVGVLLVLYQQLPLGAAKKAADLVAHHEHELSESLSLFEFSRVKFHASQLELLQPEDSRRFRAEAAKAELMRDVLTRPALLASESGVASIVDRVHAVERLYGDVPDADLLVVQALVSWQVGQTTRAVHEAASLCARAFRVRPAGFALAPLGRMLIEDFLAAPYLRGGSPLGRDSETVSSLRAILRQAAPDRPGFPLSAVVALEASTRRVRADVAAAYVRMAEAEGDVARLAGQVRGKGVAAAAAMAARAQLVTARQRRTEAAGAVVGAWEAFDRELAEIPGLAGTPAAMRVFELNDATYTRAKWFVEVPDTDEPAPLLAELGAARGGPERRAALRPPRVWWATRFAGAAGAARDVVDFQEAERWKGYESELAAFEHGVVASQAAGATGGVADAARRDTALRAARLGLFVPGEGGGEAVPYAAVLLGVGDIDAARAAATDKDVRQALDAVAAALDQRPARFFSRPQVAAGAGDKKAGAARARVKGA